MWKFEREGNLILGSLSLFLDWTGQATAIIQTTALHQEANHRKKKSEQALKLCINVFLRGEFFIHFLKTGPVRVVLLVSLSHSR